MISLGQTQQGYNLNVAQNKVPGVGYIRKFGYSQPVGAGAPPYTLWPLATIYPWDLAAGDLYWSSSSAADAGIPFMMSGQVADATFPDIGIPVEDIHVCQGQTKTLIQSAGAVDYLHMPRFVNASDDQLSVGTIYVYRNSDVTAGVPDDMSQVVAIIPLDPDTDLSAEKTQQCVYPVCAEHVMFFKQGIVTINFSGASQSREAKASLRVIQRGNVVRIMESSNNLISTGSSTYQEDTIYPEPIPAGGKVELFVENQSDTLGFSGQFVGELVHQDLIDPALLAFIKQPGY